jgi:hypothetical protein
MAILAALDRAHSYMRPWRVEPALVHPEVDSADDHSCSPCNILDVKS